MAQPYQKTLPHTVAQLCGQKPSNIVYKVIFCWPKLLFGSVKDCSRCKATIVLIADGWDKVQTFENNISDESQACHVKAAWQKLMSRLEKYETLEVASWRALLEDISEQKLKLPLLRFV